MSGSITVERATAADIRFLAATAAEAVRPPFERSFWAELAWIARTDAISFVSAAITTNVHAWGTCDDFWVLSCDGRPCASCAAFPYSDDYAVGPLRDAGRGRLAEHLGWTRATQAAVFEAYDRMWRPLRGSAFAVQAAPWIIENVAVDRCHRGRGLLRPLLDVALAQGASLGFAAAGLTLVRGNDAALRAYLALGFEVCGNYGVEHFSGEFPGAIKMKIELPPRTHTRHRQN